MSTHTATVRGPRRSISAVTRRDSGSEAAAAAAASSAAVSGSGLRPRRSVSGRDYESARVDLRRLSLNENSARGYDRALHLRRQSVHKQSESADLSAYYTFSRRKSSVVAHDDQAGLSGFLEYHKLDGSWRPFLFQTIGYQLVVYRVHVTHQVQVMSTDIRDATEITLVQDGDATTRILRLGVNQTLITLRAVTHHAAMYWVDGLQQLQTGKLPQITHDRPTIESEDDIFRQIDQMSHLREWRPPPPTQVTLCGACFSCFGGTCTTDGSTTVVQ